MTIEFRNCAEVMRITSTTIGPVSVAPWLSYSASSAGSRQRSPLSAVVTSRSVATRTRFARAFDQMAANQ